MSDPTLRDAGKSPPNVGVSRGAVSHGAHGTTGPEYPIDAAHAQSIQPSDHTAGYNTGPENGNPPGSSWGVPFVKIDSFWTKFEVWLCTIVLLLEIVALTLWVSLKGMSTPPGTSSAGFVFRALVGMIALGTLGYWIPYKQKPQIRHIVSMTGVVLGVIVAKLWTDVGVTWASNLLNWYQQASTLTLVGGLRGVGTRLTLLLALLGGSLATAAGKHITIDLLNRYIHRKARVPVAVAVWVTSSVVCFASAWGFFDHIAIENFEVDLASPPGQKVEAVAHGLEEYAFITRKQIALDLKTLPRVMSGDRYSNTLSGQEWNDFVSQPDFIERYGKEKVEHLLVPPEAKRSPMITIPDRGEPRGALNDAANLVFPIGFLIIGIRFLLLSILTISGHMQVDPEAEEKAAAAAAEARQRAMEKA